jgi:hypothetical protein
MFLAITVNLYKCIQIVLTNYFNSFGYGSDASGLRATRVV